MKKIAIFVEGHTEAKFVLRLVSEVLDKNAVQITSVELTGPIASRNITVVHAGQSSTQVDYYIMIYNCRCDGAVKSDIIEKYNSLLAASYSAIIGIRDVFPASNLADLRQRLTYMLPTNSPIPVNIILAVMEVESWFVAEENHYPTVHSGLDHTTASQETGFDIRVHSTETLPNPALTLHNIYKTVGCAYKKKDNQIQRTVDAIDYANLYIGVRGRNASLDSFLTIFEAAI